MEQQKHQDPVEQDEESFHSRKQLEGTKRNSGIADAGIEEGQKLTRT